MKVGMIGIGDIAMKAYLPVLTTYSDIEIHLCTRNKEILIETARNYRINHTYEEVEKLVKSNIKAAFVHSATASHEEIIDVLLDHNIHVYVDKPITYDYPSSRRLAEKAKQKSLVLMVGFNRRFAPPYQALKEIANPNLIMVEKHRAHQPDNARRLIFDDFIHVIDTLLNLFPYEIKNYRISGKQADGKLYHVMLQLEAEHSTLPGIMNRDAGMNEEIAKVFSPEETRTVRNINEISYHQGGNVSFQGSIGGEPPSYINGVFTI